MTGGVGDTVQGTPSACHPPKGEKPFIFRMKHLDYTTQGTCSRCIHLSLTDDNLIESVSFDGGCNGNLQGIAALVKGMPAGQVAQRVKGIRCGNKATSCPDQLAQAIEKALE